MPGTFRTACTMVGAMCVIVTFSRTIVATMSAGLKS